jgi:hypothetical protein
VPTILEVFVPGKPIPRNASGSIELEQGETHRRGRDGAIRALSPAEIAQTWTIFRFSYPPLDVVRTKA